MGFLTVRLSWRGRWVQGWWRCWRRRGSLGSGWVLAKQLLKGPLLLLDGVGGHTPWLALGSRGHSWWGALPWAGGQRLGRHGEYTQAVTSGQVSPGEPQEGSGVEQRALVRTGPHRGQRGGTTDPQLSQSLILRVVFLQEDLGGLPERRKRSGVHTVALGSRQSWPSSPSPPLPGCTWAAARARARGLGGSGICG